MASLVDSGSGGSTETSAGDEFSFDSLSAIFRYSSATRLPQPPPPPPLPASPILNRQPFFDPISYLDSTTTPPSWLRPLSASASGTDFPSLTNNPPAAVHSLDGQAAATAGSAPRSSKKRARSSRREPTTVLTTDTSNFRAMVQQFTGVPSSPFGRSSFDLFGSSADAAFGASSFLESPRFLSRPFPPPRLVGDSPSTTDLATKYRPSAHNIQDLGFGSCQSRVSDMLPLQPLLRHKSTTPAAASGSTRAQTFMPAQPIELQLEAVPGGGTGGGRCSGRLMD